MKRTERLWPQLVVAVVVIAAFARIMAAALIKEQRPTTQYDTYLIVLSGVALLIVLVGQTWRTRVVAVAAVLVLFWLSGPISAVMHSQPVPMTPIALALAAGVVTVGLGQQGRWLLTTITMVFLAIMIGISLWYGWQQKHGIARGAFYTKGADEHTWFGLYQLQGISFHPNTLGGWCVTAIVAASVLLWHRLSKRGGWRLVSIVGAVALTVVLIASLVALVWSQSRTSIWALAVAVVFALIVILTRKVAPKARRFIMITLVAAAAGLSIITVIVGTVHPAISFHGRTTAWSAALATFRENPLTGYGPDAFAGPGYWARFGTQPWYPVHAHNQVLETAAESGLLGLVPLIAATVLCGLLAARVSYQQALMPMAMMGFLAAQGSMEVILGLSYWPLSSLVPLCAVVLMVGDYRWRSSGAGKPIVA